MTVSRLVGFVFIYFFLDCHLWLEGSVVAMEPSAEELVMLPRFLAMKVEDAEGKRITGQWEDLFTACEEMAKNLDLPFSVEAAVMWKEAEPAESLYLLHLDCELSKMEAICESLRIDLKFGKTRKVQPYFGLDGAEGKFKYLVSQIRGGCFQHMTKSDDKKPLLPGPPDPSQPVTHQELRDMEKRIAAQLVQHLDDVLPHQVQKLLPKVSRPPTVLGGLGRGVLGELGVPEDDLSDEGTTSKAPKGRKWKTSQHGSGVTGDPEEFRNDPVLAPLMEVLEKIPDNKKRDALAAVYADKSTEEAKEELMRKLLVIRDWNEKMEPPPFHQLVTSTPKPGKGGKEVGLPFGPSGKAKKKEPAEGALPPIVKRAPDLERLEGTFAAPSPMGITNKPKFHSFSGDAKLKSDVDYETWRHEVISAASNNTEEAIREAMLLSLKGRAAEVARFAAQYSVTDALAILDSTFSNVSPAPVLLQEFHSEVFIAGEEIADFGTRLMDKLQRIRRLFPDEISNEDMPKMLRDRFYHGLPDRYRSTLRYYYDKDPTYEALFRMAREVEYELKANKGAAAKAKAAKAQVGKEAPVQVKSAAAVQVEAGGEEGKKARRRNRGRGGRGSATGVAANSGRGAMGNQGQNIGGGGTQMQRQQQENTNARGRGNPRGNTRGGRGRGDGRDRRNLTCFKCGGLGHDARECPTPSYLVQSGNWRTGSAETEQAPVQVTTPSSGTTTTSNQNTRTNLPSRNQ